MREFTREEIIANQFAQARRGYDPIAVDAYLEHLAEYVGWLRNELAGAPSGQRGGGPGTPPQRPAGRR